MIKAIQLIDSLHAGGAERVAVSYANALKPEILASHLCTTREEGDLKEQLNEGVGYLFLKKRSALDILAVVRLVRYCKNNQINIIHAHGSSFLTAVLAHFFSEVLKWSGTTIMGTFKQWDDCIWECFVGVLAISLRY